MSAANRGQTDRYVKCKDDSCISSQGGGASCGRLPDGVHGCNWKIDAIGYLTLDEIEGRVELGGGPSQQERRLRRKRAPLPPGGVCFWEGRTDPIACKERYRKLDQLFVQKYPETPPDMDGPRCAY
jgi:hypothetical protein